MSTNANSMTAYIHCKLCLKEIADGVPDTDADDGISPRDYQMLEAGWTDDGVQVWCRRHDVNVCHVMVKDGKIEIDGTRSLRPNEKMPIVEKVPVKKRDINS